MPIRDTRHKVIAKKNTITSLQSNGKAYARTQCHGIDYQSHISFICGNIHSKEKIRKFGPISGQKGYDAAFGEMKNQWTSKSCLSRKRYSTKKRFGN
jgi:hypothetical protein